MKANHFSSFSHVELIRWLGTKEEEMWHVTFEYVVLDWIQANLRSPWLDAVMTAITHLGDGGVLFMAMALVMLCRPSSRSVGLTLLLALALEILCCNGLLKPLLARARPFAAQGGISLLIDAPTDASFPSGHASAAFTAAAVLMFARRRLCVPVTILAVLIGFSRLYLYVHFPTDVLGGCALGYAIGWLSCAMTRPNDAPTPRFTRRYGKGHVL